MQGQDKPFPTLPNAVTRLNCGSAPRGWSSKPRPQVSATGS